MRNGEADTHMTMLVRMTWQGARANGMMSAPV